MTNTAHANCTHPATKGARSHCRSITRTKRVAAAKADALMIASPGQMDKALEVLELNAVIRIRRSFYNVVCSHSGHTYITDAASGNCSCGFGHRRMRAVPKLLKSGKPFEQQVAFCIRQRSILGP